MNMRMGSGKNEKGRRMKVRKAKGTNTKVMGECENADDPSSVL